MLRIHALRVQVCAVLAAREPVLCLCTLPTLCNKDDGVQSKATIFKAFARTAVDTVKVEGVRGLYRGFGLFTIGGFPSQG